MSPYRIKIGQKSGKARVGARNTKGAKNIDYIYPSQLAHRVVAKTNGDKYVITTPTNAKKRGLKITDRFPARDPSKRRRR